MSTSHGRWSVAILGLLLGFPLVFVSAAPASLEAKLVPSDGEASDFFGWSVAVDRDTLLVGSLHGGGPEYGPGAAYIYERAGNGWSQEAKLGPYGSAESQFGKSVAIAGDTAAVGAPFGGAGAVYLFTRTGLGWTQDGVLTGGNGFGLALSFGADANTLVVGNPYARSSSGEVVVYSRTSGTWSAVATLAESAGTWSNFGYSVSVRGSQLAIGAPALNYDQTPPRAYVYKGSNGTWLLEATLAVGDNPRGFGTSVAVDGEQMAVGAVKLGFSGSKGRAFVFSKAGPVWGPSTELTTGDPQQDAFGHSIALRGDTILVGSPWTFHAGQRAGSLYRFTLAGGIWAHQEKVVPADISPFSAFGLSIGFDGTTAVVGAYGDNDKGSESGSAYVYLLSELPNRSPTVQIGSPTHQQEVGGTFNVTGTATDSDGDNLTVEVRFDGGAWQSAQGSASWSFALDSTALSDGSHAVDARAWDGLAHSAIATAEFVVSNPEPNLPPEVLITAPEEGDTVRGRVHVRGEARDTEGGLQVVQVRIDNGTWIDAAGTERWSATLDTSNLLNGPHTFFARSSDGQAWSQLDSISVQVKNKHHLAFSYVVGGAVIASNDQLLVALGGPPQQGSLCLVGCQVQTGPGEIQVKVLDFKGAPTRFFWSAMECVSGAGTSGVATGQSAITVPVGCTTLRVTPDVASVKGTVTFRW